MLKYRGTYKVQITGSTWPVTLAEAKQHLRLEHDDNYDDTLIQIYIEAATAAAENYLDRALVPQTITQQLDEFPPVCTQLPYGEIELYRSPIAEITSINYKDTEDQSQQLAQDKFVLAQLPVPSKVVPAIDTEWPQTADQPGAITLVYTAGFATQSDIPKTIKAAILLIIADLYERREDHVKKLPTASEYLLNPHRIGLLV